MQTRDIVIEHSHGLHMRVAARIARLAEEHQARIRLTTEENRVARGDSILDMLTLGAQRGTRLTVSVEGPSEAVVADLLAGLFADGAGI